MRLASVIVLALVFVVSPPDIQAQRMQEREEDFLKADPLVGDLLPKVTVYSPDGMPFKTADLRGHYTVLTFGCLT